jgi:phenylpyruvate tautomerase
MPLLRVTVSKEVADTRKKELLKKWSSLIAKQLGKPESYMMTMFTPSVPMTFGGTEAPSAFIEIKSIGALSPVNCKALTKELCQSLEAELGIPGDRIYLEFTDVKASLWGWNQTTFG